MKFSESTAQLVPDAAPRPVAVPPDADDDAAITLIQLTLPEPPIVPKHRSLQGLPDVASYLKVPTAKAAGNGKMRRPTRQTQKNESP